jgi:arginine deiminase
VPSSSIQSSADDTSFSDDDDDVGNHPNEDEYQSMGCNILATAPGVVVVLDGNPSVRRAMEAKGIEVHAYQGGDVSLKGDGGPTCLTRELLRRA